MPPAMLSAILCAVSLAAARVSAGVLARADATCKAVPGSAAWPAPEAWAALNTTTGGRLLKPSPPGAVCFQTQPTYNAAQCAQVQAAWPSEAFHTNDPVSAEWNNWNNDTCIPIPQLNCSGAGYPIYVINATTPAHVKAGVEFAKKNNIRLIVKNTGHDFLGRSSAPNSLSLWVHHMKGIELVQDKPFVPKGCNVSIAGTGAYMVAGAGVQMIEAYEATAKINRTVVGGNGRTVALGGFLTGGGHSILAPKYGLAADHVLEMELVTPQGEILTANECQNTDLFWALRGGGGSTFGVLTKVTSSILPSPELISMEFLIQTPASNPAAFDMITSIVSQFPKLADAGVSGYPIIINSSPWLDPGATNFTMISGMLGKLIMINTRDTHKLADLFAPIFKSINTTWPGLVRAETNTTFYPSFNAWYREHFDPSPVGHENLIASRLLDAQALSGDANATKTALQKFSSGGQATVFIVSGKGVHEATPRGGGNAVLPAWRRAYVHATTGSQWIPQNEASKAQALKSSEFLASSLRTLAPETGAYMNEASRYEPNWQKTFWGDNYARLAKIKKAVDPDDVLWCYPCVGNEGWQETAENKLCRG